MALIVQKFGGTSVGDVEKIKNVARKAAAEIKRGHQVSVVVSAMSGMTNQLVEYCQSVSPIYDSREYDTVVSSGEQITSGLLAIALNALGIPARSWQGWQVPILTNDVHAKARIEDIQIAEFKKRMGQGEVPVVSGFQGVTGRKRIATLGRGGSDTSAVALAAALDADRCDIYTDVDGVFTTDPRIVPQARKQSRLTYEEMLEMASLGAKVLQTRSVEMAMKHRVRLQVLNSFADVCGSDHPGTLIVDEGEIMEQPVVSGVTLSRDEAKITLLHIPDTPGIEASIFGPLAEASINVDMIVQSFSQDNASTDMTFTVPRGDLERALTVLGGCQQDIGYAKIVSANDVVKVSIVGVGMRSHAGVAQKMFQTLASKGINIQVISTSEIKVSVVIGEDYAELAVRSLHAAYELEAKNMSA